MSKRVAPMIALTIWMVTGLMAQEQSVATIDDEEIIVRSLTEMEYPLAARLTPSTEGVVVVRVELDNEGAVTEAKAISGPKKLIADTLANARKWRFRPGPHKAAIIVYEFRMEGFCSQGSHVIFREPNVASITGCNLGTSSSPGISPSKSLDPNRMTR